VHDEVVDGAGALAPEDGCTLLTNDPQTSNTQPNHQNPTKQPINQQPNAPLLQFSFGGINEALSGACMYLLRVDGCAIRAMACFVMLCH